MIDLTKYYYFIFGVLTILGGVMGYVKAGSMASIIAGGIAGLLLIGAGVLIATHTQPGLILGLIISIALAGRFIPAFTKEYAFMPAGLMSILSIIGILLTIASLIFKR
ncbi:MAG: TMEM14 family protein [Chthoniobacteraceae bacterium]